jgi:hypothetical protein
MFCCHNLWLAPRPQSKRKYCPLASTKVLGPNLSMLGRGVPVPKSVILISCEYQIVYKARVQRLLTLFS